MAGDEAKSVASDVRDQARGLLDDTKTQVQDQSRTQRDRIVETLRTFGDDLDGMAQQHSGLASDAARVATDSVNQGATSQRSCSHRKRGVARDQRGSFSRPGHSLPVTAG